MSGQSQAPTTLPPQKGLRYALNRRIGGLQNRSGRSGAEKICCRDLNPGS